MKIGRYIVCCLLLVNFNLARADYPDASRVIDVLGEERINTLQRARDGEYRVRLLSGDVSGVQRVAVVVGESVYKTYSVAGTGRKLASLFSFRGLEGIQFSNNWNALAALPSLIAILPIHIVVTLGNLLVEKELNPVFFSVQKKSSETDDLITVVPGNTRKAKTVNILLEDGSNDIVTIAGFSYLPLVLGFEMALIFSDPGNHILHGFVGDTVLFHSMAQVVHFLYKYSSNVFFDSESSTFSPYLFPFSYWINDYRNEQMVENIIKAFRTRPEESMMLTIIEYFREPGVSRLLMDNYGFNDVTEDVLAGMPESRE
ncbi:hypothetical protein [Endozoicomonas sp.]|uniref:hypothetical protein n=1 Tax=Endozoicomonas sp. TaxID=1892382 RepID=UPI002885D59F|nr:hypothetical protein [Endozoicomonas sp.]